METLLNMGMNNKKIVWVDSDLDGVSSYLAFKWLNEAIPYKCTTVKRFRDDFSKWLQKVDINEYEQVYIIDIDTSSSLDLVDRPNITIIDHHATHAEIVHIYEKAKIHIETLTSCAKLVLKTYKHNISKLTKAQLKLISLADDYDCYELKFPETLDLNTVFWNFTASRFEKFIAEFDKGFNGFNNFHKNIIQIHNKKLADVLNDVEVYTATIPVNSANVKVVMAECDYALNEVADALIKKHNADISVIVNVVGNYVSFRRSKACTVELHKFAEKICGDGGGHPTAAGGKISDTFLNFCKIFKKI